ncbi:g10583 [Coccomyxa viridis]|uniref:G10583 protein n=1 Tax=Coccomyxa viridis TaxID=1274662 RepID=A0ABP1G5R4_9CHLO
MRVSTVLAAKNLFEVASRLEKHGIGHRIQRATWPEDSFWTITAIRPSLDGKHGDASGIFTWKGMSQHALPKRISGPLKRVWRPMQKPDKQTKWISQKKPSLGRPAEAPEVAEVEG